MDATLTESEELLRQMAARLAADLGPESLQDLEHLEDRSVEAPWKALADVGFLALRAPAAAGGGDASTVEAAIVAEALGAALLPAPFLGVAALTTELLLAAGAPTETLARVGTGELRLAVAMGADLVELAVSGPSGAPGAPDDGEEAAVAPDAAGAEGLLLLERSVPGAPAGLTAVPAGPSAPALDLTRRWARPAAGNSSSGSSADRGGSPAAPGGAPGLASLDLGGPLSPEALAGFECRALVLIAADLVGVGAAALGQAVEYARGRVQFGAPIGSFQAVQHLCAEQAVSLEGARALVHQAAWAADSLPLDEALLAARSAKAYCSAAGRSVTEAVVQVFGGMGITWECLAHVSLKRAMLDAAWFGEEGRQLNEIAALRAKLAGVP